MTVKELIEALEAIENKDLKVVYALYGHMVDIEKVVNEIRYHEATDSEEDVIQVW